MSEKTFEQATEEFLAAARQERLPEMMANNLIELYRGPISGADAIGTATRWFTARPGDPVANLTLNEIHGLFQKAHDDWKRSLKALDEIWTRSTAPAHIQKVAEISRQADWQSLRNRIASEIKAQDLPSVTVLRHFDSYANLAQKGLVREPLVTTLQHALKAANNHATSLAELAAGGIASTGKRRSWDPWDEVAAGGAVVGAGATYYCYGAAEASIATVGSAAAWGIGAVAGTAVAAFCVGYLIGRCIW